MRRVSSFSLASSFVSIALACASAASAQVSGPYILYRYAQPAAGTGPTDVALGHLIKDSGTLQHLDAVSTATKQDQVRVWKGDGKGNLGNVTTITGGTTPVAVAVVDLNKDGSNDILVANYQSNNVSILIGNGSGSFVSKVMAVPARPTDIATGDFNQDGNPDAIVTSETLGRVTVLLGDGKGALTPQSSFTKVGLRPSSVGVADLNGDKYPDAVATNLGTTVSVLVNNKMGGFTTSTVTVGSTPVSVAFGDFDGKTGIDAAVVNRDSNTVSILIGDGIGGLKVASSPSVGQFPRAVAAGDLNGDGSVDLLVANGKSNELTILLNDGAGAFPSTKATRANLSTNPSSIAAGDLDNDGLIDAVGTNEAANGLSILLNGPFKANRIFGLTLANGTLSSGTFLGNSTSWDTFPGSYDNSGHFLGVTNPGKASAFLNRTNHSIEQAADRSYWLYGDSRNFGPRALVKAYVWWGAGVSESAVFHPACPPSAVTQFYRLEGTRKIELGRPISGLDRVFGNGIGPNGYTDHTFVIKVHTKEPQATKQQDLITGIRFEPGTYNNFTSKNFASSGTSRDTWSGYYSNFGHYLGITSNMLKQPFLNCRDSSVTLLPNQEYFAWADTRDFETRIIMRVHVRWASKNYETADFLVGCDEQTAIPRFQRLQGTDKIELGRTGITKIDRMHNSGFQANGWNDYIFSLKVYDQAPPKRRTEDLTSYVYFRNGSFRDNVFVWGSTGWDTVPGARYQSTNYLGITPPAKDAPFLNCADGRVTLPPARLYAYADKRYIAGQSAMEVTVLWGSGKSESAVFKVGSFAKAEQWQKLKGSKSILLGGTGLTQIDRLKYNGIGTNGVTDYVLDLRINATGGYVAYGRSCKGTRGLPSLAGDPLALPLLGKPFRIILDKLKDNSVGAVTFGAQTKMLLDAIGATGCTLYVNPSFSMAFPTGSGDKVSPFNLTVPSSASLIGVSFYNQCVFFDPNANKLGLVFTNAGWGRVGK